MSEKIVNPEIIDSSTVISQDKVLKIVKRSLIVMTILIAVGICVLFGVLLKRNLQANTEFSEPRDAVRILLPNGSLGQVQALALSGNKELTFSVDSPQGSTIYVINLISGKLISEVHLVRQSSPIAMNKYQHLK